MPVEEHPVLGMPSHRLGECPALNVGTDSGQRLGRLRMVDAFHIPLEDRPLVEVGRHLVRCGTDEFFRAVIRLEVRTSAPETGKERVVDVDGTAAQRRRKLGRQDLCVSR